MLVAIKDNGGVEPVHPGKRGRVGSVPHQLQPTTSFDSHDTGRVNGRYAVPECSRLRVSIQE
jgi:hypothetical protein